MSSILSSLAPRGRLLWWFASFPCSLLCCASLYFQRLLLFLKVNFWRFGRLQWEGKSHDSCASMGSVCFNSMSRRKIATSVVPQILAQQLVKNLHTLQLLHFHLWKRLHKQKNIFGLGAFLLHNFPGQVVEQPFDEQKVSSALCLGNLDKSAGALYGWNSDHTVRFEGTALLVATQTCKLDGKDDIWICRKSFLP